MKSTVNNLDIVGLNSSKLSKSATSKRMLHNAENWDPRYYL